MSSSESTPNQQANHLLSELVDSLDQGIALCDIENLTFIESNKAFAAWFILDNSKSSLSDIFSDDTVKRIYNAIAKKRIYRFKHVATINRRDQHLDLNVKVITLGNGQHYLVVQVIQNNNEQQMIKMVKDHSDLNEKSKEMLEQAVVKAESANHAKSMFLAAMSHELRTPLNGILGMAQQMFTSSLSEEQTEYLTTIQQSGNQLLATINQVLDLSNIEDSKIQLHPEAIDIKKLINDVVMLCSASSADKSLSLISEVPKQTLPLVLVDVVRLKQVLINLVNNAMKFTQQGVIKLQLVLLKSDKTSCQLRFAVIDTGIGIHPDKTAHLFESFAQNDSSTTRSFGGAGLGLTISSKMVGLMGGEIDVQSELDKGSEFSFILKLSVNNEAQKAEALPPAEFSKEYLSDKKILVVDDVKTNITIMSLVLKKTGAEVIVAENGLQAVEAFKANQVDLILMDCLMPVMDGFEATRDIRALELGTKHTLIFAVTASASEEIAAQCKASGMDDIILKPFQFDELLARLQQALTTKHTL